MIKITSVTTEIQTTDKQTGEVTQELRDTDGNLMEPKKILRRGDTSRIQKRYEKCRC